MEYKLVVLTSAISEFFTPTDEQAAITRNKPTNKNFFAINIPIPGNSLIRSFIVRTSPIDYLRI